jgi:hypothetical protein
MMVPFSHAAKIKIMDPRCTTRWVWGERNLNTSADVDLDGTPRECDQYSEKDHYSGKRPVWERWEWGNALKKSWLFAFAFFRAELDFSPISSKPGQCW